MRGGRITVAQRRALENKWNDYGIAADSAPNWQHVFNRSAPLHIEIGCGHGEATAELARLHPQNNYVALETYAPGVGALLHKLTTQNLENVRVVFADAVVALPLVFADGEVDMARIFFPDPWPKKRHHKRRLINAKFVELLAQKITQGGGLHIATDWAHYAEQIRDCFVASAEFASVSAMQINCPPRPPTRFAARAAKENRAAEDLIYQRV